MKKIKALYARQSLYKKGSQSIEGQIEECKALLKPTDDYKEYTDRGFSGKNTERPALNNLLNDVKKGIIDEVIVYRLDRFSRNITDFYNLYEVLKEHDCDFKSVNEDFDTGSPMGRAMMGILVAFAQMERESIQERVKDNYYYRIAQDGRWAGGPAPYGFTNGRTEDGKPMLTVNPQEIDIVKFIFQQYTEELNISLGKIANKLTKLGFKSRRKNGAWDNVTISRILQNPVYVTADSILYKFFEIRQIKFLNPQDEWNGTTSCHIVGKRTGNANIRKYTDLKEQSVYLTNIKGIIDSRTYIVAMNRLANNEQLGRSNQPSVLQELGGKLKCSCGYAIKSYSKSTTGRPYLDCHANRTLHACSHKYNYFNFYEIQKTVANEVQHRLEGLKDVLKEKEGVRKNLRKRIKTAQSELDNLISLTAKMADNLQTSVVRQIEGKQKKINELELELQMNADLLDFFQIPHFGTNGWQDIYFSNMSLEEKKYIINLFIDKIILYEESESLEILWKI